MPLHDRPIDKDVQTIREMIYDATDDTPTFLNGILVPGQNINAILHLLDGIEFNLSLGRSYQEMTEDGIKESEKMIGSLIGNLLSGRVSIDGDKPFVEDISGGLDALALALANS